MCRPRSSVPCLTLLPPGGALLFDTIQQGVGGSPEALAAVLDTLQACRPMAALRYLVAHCSCNHSEQPCLCTTHVSLQANFVVYRNTYGYFQLL